MYSNHKLRTFNRTGVSHFKKQKYAVMKKIILLPFLALILTACNHPNSFIVKISRSGTDPKNVHESANDFSLAVGRYLKGNYPSRVTDVVVTISANIEPLTDGSNYTIKWSAKIEPCDSVDADYFFDRRGTLLSGPTEVEAIKAVQKEIEVSGKVESMINNFDETYGNHRMTEDYVSVSTVCLNHQSGKNVWWCLKEYFCTAKKE